MYKKLRIYFFNKLNRVSFLKYFATSFIYDVNNLLNFTDCYFTMVYYRVPAVTVQVAAKGRWRGKHRIWARPRAPCCLSTRSMTSCCGRCLWIANRWRCSCGNKAKKQWPRYVRHRNSLSLSFSLSLSLSLSLTLKSNNNLSKSHN